MSRSKKIFIALASVFFMFLVYVSYDISTRTTFPGSQEKETTGPSRSSSDSLSGDSLKNDAGP